MNEEQYNHCIRAQKRKIARLEDGINAIIKDCELSVMEPWGDSFQIGVNYVSEDVIRRLKKLLGEK